MPVLAAGEVILAALVILNLALTLAIIRRLRTTSAVTSVQDPGGLDVGVAVPDFTARSTDDEIVTSTGLTGRETLVGIFASDCVHCGVEAPKFAAAATMLAGNGVRTVAIVAEHVAGAGSALALQLTGIENVIVEPRPGPVGTVFGAEATPAYYFIDEHGSVVSRGITAKQAVQAAKSGELVASA